MTLGALVDLGVPVDAIQAAVRSMGLPEITISSRETKKKGFRAVSIQIDHPPEHAHRHLHHITEMIDGATEIESSAKELAKRIFGHVAVAEAKVHGTTLEKVHFHEVGAIDSIADIVGAAVGINHLGITAAMSAPVPTGTGKIKIAHGLVSVPAPATAEILKGIPIQSSDIVAELTTPTGAAILKELCGSFGPVPQMTIDQIGYGAGTMDLDDQANMLRVLVGEVENAMPAAVHQDLEQDQVVVIETNVDDSTGEELADCTERLILEGALDVTQTPCTMKKGRSGIILSVLCRPQNVKKMERLLLQHTSTIGVRRYAVSRSVLSRKETTVTTPWGELSAKVVAVPGGTERIKVDSDVASRVATEHGITTAIVRRTVEKSFG